MLADNHLSSQKETSKSPIITLHVIGEEKEAWKSPGTFL